MSEREKIVEIMARACWDFRESTAARPHPWEDADFFWKTSYREEALAALSALEAAGHVIVPKLCDTGAIDRAWKIYQERPHCEERFVAAINTYLADASAMLAAKEPTP